MTFVFIEGSSVETFACGFSPSAVTVGSKFSLFGTSFTSVLIGSVDFFGSGFNSVGGLISLADFADEIGSVLLTSVVLVEFL